MEPIRRFVADLADVLSGYHARKGIEPDRHGSHFLLQIGDFKAERTAIESESLIRFSPSSVKKEQLLRDNDVLFLAKGGKPFGYAATGLPDPTLAAGYFFILRPRAEVHPGFLAWYLNQETSLRYFARNSGSSTGMPVVRRDILEKLPVDLPSLERQERIVEMNHLMLHEQELYQRLAERKNQLWKAMCLRAAKEGNQTRDDDV